MKISPERLLTNSYKFKSPKNIYLITGNEETYIKKIQTYVEKFLKNHNYNDKQNFEKSKIRLENENIENINFFSNKKIIIYTNPTDIDIDYLPKINLSEFSIIIVDHNLNSSSKIKKYFDAHDSFCSISCYSLTRNIKKLFFDYFLKKNNIFLDEQAYWFFLDCSDNRYLIFEQELNKLVNLNSKKINLKEIKLLINLNENKNLDKVFFSIHLSANNIIKNSNINLNSSSDGYLLLQRAKFYFNLSLSFSNNSEARDNFPKYLFAEKDNFMNLFYKLNPKKIIKFIKLINKTEILLRKNNGMFLIISQRFLLNLKKNIH